MVTCSLAASTVEALVTGTVTEGVGSAAGVATRLLRVVKTAAKWPVKCLMVWKAAAALATLCSVEACDDTVTFLQTSEANAVFACPAPAIIGIDLQTFRATGNAVQR